MSSTQPRAVIFDLDGTLIDSFADIAAALNAALLAHGAPAYDVPTVRAMVGDGVGKLIERAAPGADAVERAGIVEEMLDYYRQHPVVHATIYPGIVPALKRLVESGVHCAVLSNKPHDLTIACCKGLGLDRYLADIRGEDPPRFPRKPDTAGLLAQLAALHHPRAIFVGDGLPDAQVSAAAGLPFVAALWGTRTRAELEPYRPILFAERAEGLENALLPLLA